VLFNPQHPKEVITPNLDALAKQNVICRQGYVTGNVSDNGGPLAQSAVNAPLRGGKHQGSQAGWWAVRSGDWKLVGDKARVGLFDLSKDGFEKNDLVKAMPEKVAELTKLHDAWLAEMPNPVKSGAKRYGMTLPGGDSPVTQKKKTPEENQKARDEERAKRRAAQKTQP
jgi:arylsulfatase A-like enzyme